MSGIIHFDVPGRWMLFEETQICPVLAGLRVDGLVVGTEGQHHLIATFDDIRFLLGPTDSEVARRAMIVRQALVHSANQLSPLHADAVEAWVNLCWQALQEELAEDQPPSGRRGGRGCRAPSAGGGLRGLPSATRSPATTDGATGS
ncbi:MAG: hypothetical protein WCG47_06015 [Dermatophilaceae bacterium]